MTGSLLIVDDHSLLRESMAVGLRSLPFIQSVAEAKDSEGAIALTLERNPDLILVDLSLGEQSGFDLLPKLAACSRRSKLVVLTMHCMEAYAVRALELGASAYLTKRLSLKELGVALGEVLSGSVVLDAGLDEARIRKMQSGDERVRFERWPSRRLQVLRRLLSGWGAAHIAEDLSISEKTVESHRSNIFRMLRTKSTPELIAKFQRNGWGLLLPGEESA